MSILEISKTLIYESWYNYIKPKYQNNAKLCYMIQTALLLILKLKIFIKILQMMFWHIKLTFEFEFNNYGRVLSAKDNNESKS